MSVHKKILLCQSKKSGYFSVPVDVRKKPGQWLKKRTVSANSGRLVTLGMLYPHRSWNLLHGTQVWIALFMLTLDWHIYIYVCVCVYVCVYIYI
jgi:hypothetical protein